jgi:3-oxoacyl-[acyl-carrier protein] reductase
MDLQMTGKKAIVTGASEGIGKAITWAFAREGVDVAICARRKEPLEAVAAEISRATNRQIVPITADLTKPADAENLVKKAHAALGRIDILVNNAGLTRDGLALRMKRDDWDAVIQTNLSGSFFCIQQVMPAMVRERWGRIVNITSVVGESGNAGQANYAASKAGLIGLTKSLAQELASRNITVNAVAPGFVETDMTGSLSDELKAKITESVPLKRIGKPEDIAAAVKFLASDDASYITGHVLDVNGGMFMR